MQKIKNLLIGLTACFFLNLIISISVFTYIAYTSLIEMAAFNSVTFFKLLFGVAAVVLIKTLFERLIGSLFEIDTLIESYLFQKTSYKNYIGFILLPINILLVYTLQPNAIIIYTILGVLALINLNGFLTTFKNHQKVDCE